MIKTRIRLRAEAAPSLPLLVGGVSMGVLMLALMVMVLDFRCLGALLAWLGCGCN